MPFRKTMNWLTRLPHPKSRLFAIEGSDGTGKATHTKMLQTWLEDMGYEVAVYSFPQYTKPSAKLVEMYLNREFGNSVNALDPYQASVCYAFDRQIAAPNIRKNLIEGKIVLCDRYKASNDAHQGAKIADRRQRRQFYRWLNRLEYDMLGVIRPHKTFVLQVDAEIAQKMAAQKPIAAHLTNKQGDLHEHDLEHLSTASSRYIELCQLNPLDYVLINCVDDNGQLQDIPTISRKLQNHIRPLL